MYTSCFFLQMDMCKFDDGSVLTEHYVDVEQLVLFCFKNIYFFTNFSLRVYWA